MNKSKNFPDCFYRVSVKGLYISDGKILLSREAESLSGQWEMPGGGLDFGEEPAATLSREVREEMGLEVVSVSKQPIYVWTVYFDKRRSLDWFYSLVLVYQIELKDLNFTKSEECEEIGLFTKAELAGLDLHQQSQPLLTHFVKE